MTLIMLKVIRIRINKDPHLMPLFIQQKKGNPKFLFTLNETNAFLLC